MTRALTLAATLVAASALVPGCNDVDLEPTQIACTAMSDCPASFECRDGLCSYCKDCVGSPPAGANGLPAITCPPDDHDASASFLALPECGQWVTAAECACAGAAPCLEEIATDIESAACLSAGDSPDRHTALWTQYCGVQRDGTYAQYAACKPM